jgi:arsenate reductase
MTMKATIWHNPACGTSRKTLAFLQETPGVEVTVIEYLKAPYTRDKLAQIIRDAGLTPREAIRKMGTDAEEKGLPGASDDAILDAMTANPAYVNRPFVETDKGVRFCRPQDVVREIL